MSVPSYPYYDLEGGRLLLAQIGSFWTRIFADKKQLQEHLRSSGNEQNQTWQNYLETVATISRLTVPVFHTQDWYFFTISENAVNDFASVYQADDLVYGAQPGTREGRPEGFVQTYGGRDRPEVVQIPLPDSLKEADFTLQNAVTLPSLVWVYGTDYTIDESRSVLRFAEDPFKDPRVSIRDVLDEDGEIVDREIGVWAYKGSLDLDYIWEYCGYVLQMRMSSSQEYKDLLNALWDMYVQGPSKRGFEVFLAAAAATPTIIDPEETVEVVRTEGDTKLIVTSSRSYRVPSHATVIVNVGDVLHVGDPVTDAVQIAELCGANPDYSLVNSLALSPSMISGDYVCELIFRNEQVALEYMGTDENGRVMVRFEVSGFPPDVERFWDIVHANGVAAGATLAELLDQRTNKVGQPSPSALPTYVNPLELVVGNIMRNNLFVVRMNAASFGTDAPGTEMLAFLRRIMVPHTTYVVLFNIGQLEEEYELEASQVEEGIGLWLGPGIMAEELEDFAEDLSIAVRAVTPWCQEDGS
jgi:hypothetical protein